MVLHSLTRRRGRTVAALKQNGNWLETLPLEEAQRSSRSFRHSVATLEKGVDWQVGITGSQDP